MTAPASLDDLLVALTTAGHSEAIPFFKDGRQGANAAVAPTQGRWMSLWTFNGAPGGTGVLAGATPRYPTNNTAGSMGQTDPGGGRQKYLLGGSVFACAEGGSTNLAGKLMMYDRLGDLSGLSGTTTGAQTVNLNAITRYSSNADCVGNEIAVEVNTQVGTTARTITALYTNQAGTAGQVTQAVNFGATGFREANYMAFLPLASGDTGVKSVQSVTLSGSTLTAGDFSVVLLHRLYEIQLSAAGTMHVRDLNQQAEGIREVLAGACLTFAWFASIATLPSWSGLLQFAEN